MSEDNKSYVYVHRLVSSNEVFYVGSGKHKRMYSQHHRSRPWKNIVENNDWYYSLLKSELSKSEAENLELSLIELYKPVGNVIQVSQKHKSIDQISNYIKSNIKYDEKSPSCLSFIKDNGALKQIKTKNGQYYIVNIENKRFLASRVIWYILTGEDPLDFVIDHIDGDTRNNSIGNLRKVSRAANNKNVRLKKNNKTGFSGVAKTSSGYYYSNVTFNLTIHKKYFSIKKYGENLALALAVESKFRKIRELNCTGASFTERHMGEYTRLPILCRYAEEEICQMLSGKYLDNLNTKI